MAFSARRRFIVAFSALLLIGFLLVPHFTYADDILSGSLVPTCNAASQAGNGFSGACQLCDLFTLADNLIRFAVAFSVVVATLMFAYAGILYVTAAANPENIKKAHGIFAKVFVGLIIVLVAWLVVDTLIKALANDNLGDSGAWGPWHTIQCIAYPEGVRLAQYTPSAVNGIPSSVANGTHLGTGAQCAPGSTACGTAFLQTMGMSAAQANTMSCIAMTESSGHADTPDSRTGACGTFQILARNSNSNWNQPSLHAGRCSTATSCNDPYCNAQSASILMQHNVHAGRSAYSDWTCPGCNANAQACVNRYDPGH